MLILFIIYLYFSILCIYLLSHCFLYFNLFINLLLYFVFWILQSTIQNVPQLSGGITQQIGATFFPRDTIQQQVFGLFSWWLTIRKNITRVVGMFPNRDKPAEGYKVCFYTVPIDTIRQTVIEIIGISWISHQVDYRVGVVGVW